MKNVHDQNLQVLLVEPDNELGETIKGHLAQRGIVTTSVAHPSEALEKLKSSAFSFVISELELPEYSGWDLSMQIRELSLSQLPEVLLISDKQYVDIEMAHQSGACHMLAKPFQFDVLVDTLNHYRPKVEDLRRFERIDVDTRIYGPLNGILKTAHGNIQSFEISNVGRGGIFMELNSSDLTEVPLTLGQVIDFHAKLSMVPDFTLNGKGIIRWTKEGIFTVGAGVEFLQLDPDSEALIDSYVKLFRIKPFVPGKQS